MGKACNRMPRPIHTILGASVACLLAMATSNPVLGQQVNQLRGPAGCIPISERKMELGCYVVTAEALGELPRTQLYWQIVSYPTRSAADAAKGARGTVVEAVDQIWLMTIAEAGYRPTGGTLIAEIGPLSTKAGTKYTATYMQGIMMPGADTPVHYHAGPEALYTLAGEECMETTEGKFASRPGGTPIIVPGETSHKLTITGTTQRRSLALILADSAQPLMLMGAHDHNWTPKGLCKVE
jgi:quercetin dioxygenase-like cupin family protein